jgi:hypothetical protein
MQEEPKLCEVLGTTSYGQLLVQGENMEKEDGVFGFYFKRQLIL